MLVYMTNYEQVRELNLFAIVLVVQSLPFTAAVAVAALERTPLNDFAVWRTVMARIAEVVPRRQTTPATANGQPASMGAGTEGGGRT